MTAEEILVIFLSFALAIFLTLGIVLLAFCIRIATQINRITTKAENLVDQAGNVVEHIQKASTLNTVGNVVSHIVKAFGKNKSKGEESDE